jgi:uncharacterized protein
MALSGRRSSSPKAFDWSAATAGSCLATLLFLAVLGVLWLFAAGLRPPAAPDIAMDLAVHTGQEQERAAMEVEDGVVASPLTRAAFSGLATTRPDEPLSSAPDPALMEVREVGILPIIGTDGRSPRQAYARPFDRKDDRARLVLIVVDIGLSRAASEAAIAVLPGAVTLAVDAYAPDPTSWARAARLSGHEVIATVPVQENPSPARDVGPRALRPTGSGAENVRRLEILLGALTGYVGVISVGGQLPGNNHESLHPVIGTLTRRGLLLVDGTTSSPGSFSRAAERTGLPRLRVDIQLDAASDASAISRQLVALLGIARERFVAVAVAHPLPVTLGQVSTWISGLDERRYVLAPVSAVADATGGP